MRNRNSTKTAACLCYFLSSVALSIASDSAQACESRVIRVTGNLNSETTAGSGPPQPSEPISEQIAAAQESIELAIFDSQGRSHSAVVLFFRVADNPPWIGRLIITDEDYVPPTGASRVFPDSPMTYLGSERFFAPPDTNAPFNWGTGTTNDNVDFSFEPTNLPAATSLAVTQDGSSGGCTQYGNLDFDGDGKDDLAIYRPSVGIWAILKSSVQQKDFIFKQWGLPGDYPMPGDHDGDGIRCVEALRGQLVRL